MSFFLTSCIGNKSLTYLNSSKTISALETRSSYLLRSNDLVYIIINTNSTKVNKYFGLANIQEPTVYQNLEQSPSLYLKSYAITDSGMVKLPVIGNVMIKNKTLHEAEQMVQDRMNDFFLSENQVTLKLANNSFTILGEVNVQGRYFMQQDKINILDALGIGKGLTDYADPTSIKVVREYKDDTQTYLVDLNKKDPSKFIIFPNDIIYVRPFKKGAQKQVINPSASTVLSGLSSMLILISLFTR